MNAIVGVIYSSGGSLAGRIALLFVENIVGRKLDNEFFVEQRSRCGGIECEVAAIEVIGAITALSFEVGR